MLEFLLSRLVAFVEVSITARPLAKPYYILSYPHAGLLSLFIVGLSVGVSVRRCVCVCLLVGNYVRGLLMVLLLCIVLDVNN